MSKTLNTTTPEQLIYQTEHLYIEILGGIRLDRLDGLRVTLKMQHENQTLRHSLDLYNDIQVTKLIRRAAGKLQLGMGSILDAIEELTTELEQYRLDQRSESENKIEKKKLTKQEVKKATELLKSKNLLEVINELIGKAGVIGEENNRLLMYIIFTSRKMSNPLHIISMGASGTGKSHLQESVAALIPEEDTLSVTSLSESSFYYFEPTALVHKLILIEDMDGLSGGGSSESMGAMYAIRELQSKKMITKTFVQKTTKGPQTTSRTVFGPICVAGCTTKERIYEDNSNRSFIISIDQSKEQDIKIINHQQAVSAGQLNTIEKLEATNLLQNAQRLLKPIKVVNPYAELLSLPSSVFKPRRTNAHYLHFIEAVTFLCQAQRTSKVEPQSGEEYILTTIEDIEQANELMKEVLLRKSDKLSPACRAYFEELKAYLLNKNNVSTKSNSSVSGSDHFKNVEVRQVLGVSLSKQKHYMRELINNFYVQIKSGNQKQGFTYKITSFKEYIELKSQITSVLDETLERLKQVNQEPSNKKELEKVSRS